MLLLLAGVSSVVTWLPKISTSCCRPGARERCRTSKKIQLNENLVVPHHLDKREFWGLSQKYLEPSILFKDWTITDSERIVDLEKVGIDFFSLMNLNNCVSRCLQCNVKRFEIKWGEMFKIATRSSMIWHNKSRLCFSSSCRSRWQE